MRVFSAILSAIACALLSFGAGAQTLATDAQATALRTAVCADPTAAQYQTGVDTANVRDWLNAQASPAFTLWRRLYSTQMLRQAILVGSTQLDGLTAGKRDSLLWVASADLDMTQTYVRAALDDLTGGQAALKAAVLDGGKRAATRAEKLLSTGAGTTASPATSAIEGALTDLDAQRVVLRPDGQPWGC